MMRISFLGGAGTVTGSKFLIEHRGRHVLVDCGLFQGLKPLRLRNWAPLPFDPREIDAVVLTHAHLDHSGFLPAITRAGFKGPVWCTPATFELCRLLLPDSGRIQQEDAEYANRKGFSKHHPARPLYDEDDALAALKHFRTVAIDQPFEPAPGFSARLSHAGHILGAASVRLEAGGGRSVLFSGDLGRADDPLMHPPSPPPSADWLVLESTYGDRLHEQADPAGELAEAIGRTIGRGGSLLIPAFAVGRAQLLLHLIARLKADRRIGDVPVYLNSPMAIDTTALYRRFADEHRLDRDGLRALGDVAKMVRSVEESKALTRNRWPSVIISASGMATGGRVLHHLKALGPDERNTILLVGYQAPGTRGADLANGKRLLRIHGADHVIRAEVVSMSGLSAHADADGLLDWASRMPRPPRRVLLTHGEPAASAALGERLRRTLGIPVDIPGDGTALELD